MESNFIHSSAEIHQTAIVGANNYFWHNVQIMDNVNIGSYNKFGKGVYIGSNTFIGNKIKIGNYSSIFGAILQDEVFIGPQTVLVEDPTPRSTNLDGTVKTQHDFDRKPVQLFTGCSLGASVTILPGVVIGKFAFVAAGSVVFESVPDHSFIIGNPGRIIGMACLCGSRLDRSSNICLKCGLGYKIQGDQIYFNNKNL